MTVLTAEEKTHLTALAEAIPNEGLRNNALSLIERMEAVIEGIGDRPITWQPTILKVLQSMSNMDNVTEGDGGAPVAAGSLVASNQTVPNGLPVIPLCLWQSRSLWDPDTDNVKRLCSSPDAKIGWAHGSCYECSFGTSKEEGKAPACNKEYSFLVIAADLSDIFRITFAKSQYKSGMDWQKEISYTRTHPYKRVYAVRGDSSAKNKKVKEIRASLLGNTNGQEFFSEEYMAFLEALYLKQTHDRKQSLIDYHANYEKRLLLRADGDSGHGIEDHSGGENHGGNGADEVATASGDYAF